ncbi:hypothetical protein SAMN06264364_1294 [Quadrisphaera granulorum]|uniref:Uncharacterized protein n=1 Tax=Quadrisphaera granulorum TaxID=317664 RepID=A0A315ZTW8_9ACTN|nr:hypothetical protein [Quadrisphaera granulorum]PWJ48623.1 hypothetical protein BXY45_1294 [Quadrisphaera granulorum]SZE98345.1 hypothetical protein SAMN06264364_1294 [Quadrisphaera granulorum]
MSKDKKKNKDDDERAARDEERAIERYGIDERTLTPIGLTTPGGRFVPEAVVNVVRFVWLGTWIALFAGTQTTAALIVMFAWIAANGAYENHRKKLRRERKRQIQRHIAARGGDPTALDATADVPAALAGAPAVPAAPIGVEPSSSSAPAAQPAQAGLSASPAERALARTLRRVESSDRFERRDAVLVGELADVLFPLLAKVAEPGADPLVRRDVETIATEHLPDSIDAFLALPAEHVRTSRNTAGRTPLEELRRQLDLLLTGCEQLQEAVLRSDVARQQAQSRFLEEKFRPSGLDL